MSSELAEFTLSDLCELIADCPHSTPKWTSSGFLVLRNQNIKAGRLDLASPSFTNEEHFRHRTRRAEPQTGDLVITREAPMGEVCLIPAGLECCLGQRQVLLRPNPKKLDSRYFLYALQSPYLQNQIGWNEGTGSTVSNLRIPVLSALKLPTPPLDDQREIGSFLGALDNRITLLRETNKTLEAIAQAIFKSWFVNFDPVRAKMEGRQPVGMDEETAALFPDELVQSELGLIPKGWETSTLGKEVNIAYGKNLPTANLRDTGYPVFGGNGLIGFYDRYLYESRQILVACRGAASGKVNQSVSKSFVTNNSLVLEPTESSRIRFGFAKGWMLKTDLTQFVTGSAQPQVTIENLKHCKILVPDFNLVCLYEKFSSVLEDSIDENKKHEKGLADIRDTLLPRLISGKLRVPIDETEPSEA